MSGIPGGLPSTGNPVAVSAVVDALIAATDGATVMPSGQSYGGSGIIVAVPEHGLVITPEDCRRWQYWSADGLTDAVNRWVERNAANVTNAQSLRPRAFGAWSAETSTGRTIYLDVVEIFPDDEETAAVEAGRARNQIAIWHAGRGEEIATGGTGGAGHTLYYVSQDYPVTGSWSVYREQYVHPDAEEPIDGTQTWVSTHATEAEAYAEQDRLQRTV